MCAKSVQECLIKTYKVTRSGCCYALFHTTNYIKTLP